MFQRQHQVLTFRVGFALKVCTSVGSVYQKPYAMFSSYFCLLLFSDLLSLCISDRWRLWLCFSFLLPTLCFWRQKYRKLVVTCIKAYSISTCICQKKCTQSILFAPKIILFDDILFFVKKISRKAFSFVENIFFCKETFLSDMTRSVECLSCLASDGLRSKFQWFSVRRHLTQVQEMGWGPRRINIFNSSSFLSGGTSKLKQQQGVVGQIGFPSKRSFWCCGHHCEGEM